MIDPRRRYDDSTERAETLADDVQARIRVSIPVRVIEDSDGHTVRLQPLIKARQRKPDGTVTMVDLAVIEDGPINHHGGGGTTVTHAHKKGDEGAWVIADRAIDVWFKQGGIQLQADTRMHDLSDGMFVPGLRNDPRKLDPAPNRQASETRSDDGKIRRTTDPVKGHSDTVKNGAHGVTLDGRTGELKATAKTVEVRSGEKAPGGQPDTGSATDLNMIVKGLRAEITQVKDSHHALFDVVSKLRMNAESVIPQLAIINLATQVTMALNGQPAGLDAMKALAQGKLQDYFQNALKDALGGFLDPSRLLSAATLLSGGVEGLIAAAQAQIAQLVAQNPVVGQIEDLRRQADQLASGGVPNDVVLSKIASLVAQNPVAQTVQNLRAQIASLAAGAGAGIDFLGPQKRAAQGIIRSLTLKEG